MATIITPPRSRCSQKLPALCFKFQRQVRHASLIKRPYRPYTFTQLVMLSDGSTYTTRTTSPEPVLKSTKDSRNHPLWQPSSAALRNIEADEAGRLRAFRLRFGRGWDAEEKLGDEEDEGRDEVSNQNFMDLINEAGLDIKKAAKTKLKLQPEDDPDEKLVLARNALGKMVQVKVKNLEQFRKDQKSAKGG